MSSQYVGEPAEWRMPEKVFMGQACKVEGPPLSTDQTSAHD